MTGPQPRISVVIPTFGRPEQLVECLTALAGQIGPVGGFEVIVVDDGNAEPLDWVFQEFSRRLDLRLVRQSNQGPGAARNAGARLARARYLAFLDDDCRPAPEWLACLTDGLDRNPDHLIGGRVVNALEENLYATTSQLILELAYAHHNAAPGDPQFFASNNMVVAAGRFREIGGFDETFRPASEDRDLCARWREAGLRLTFVPEAVVGHAHRLTLGRFWTQHAGYGRGAWRFHRARRRRGHGQLGRDVKFHWRFLRQAAARLSGRRWGSALRIALLLMVWQVANAAGFLLEAAGRASHRR